jgi:hypothetical protein
VTEPNRPNGMWLWWLSFVDSSASAPPDQQVPGGGGFLGVSIVAATDPLSAVQHAWDLGCNPGGEVGILGPIPLDVYPPEVRNRLLTQEEAEAL